MNALRKGQGSIELLVLIGFLFVVFTGFILVIQTKVNEQQHIQRQDIQAQLIDLMERELILAQRVRSGYMRSFEVPRTLSGENYTLEFEDNSTLVVKGELSENEYVRFAAANASLVRPTGDTTDLILSPNRQLIILERSPSGVRIRKDCVAAGKTHLTCQRSA